MDQLVLITDKKIDTQDFLNVFLLLCLSGITFFSGEALLFLVFVINLSLFIYKKKRIDTGFLNFFIFFVVLSAAQILWFSDGSLSTYAGFFIRIITAYLVIKNCNNFIKAFLGLLFFLSLASIVIYIFFVLFPSVEALVFSQRSIWDNPDFPRDKSLIIYNIHHELLFAAESLGLFGLPRNSGPFWEPGAFGGYLTLGIAMETLISRKMSRRIWVFLVAMFTTFSTSAYMDVAVFYLLYFLFINNEGGRLVILLPLMVAVVWFSLFNLDFLGPKIEEQFQEFNEGNVYSMQAENDTRIGSASLDFKDLQRSPLLGTGSSDETRWGPDEKLFFRSNGLTDFLVRVGIIGFVYCFLFLFSSGKRVFYKLIKKKIEPSAWVFTFMIFFLAFSETFFSMPFFWSLFFLGYSINEPETESE